MNQTWTSGDWWGFAFAAFAASLFTSWLWMLGRNAYARDALHKKIDLIRGFLYLPPSSKCRDRTPEQGRKNARLTAILSISLATVLVLFMEGHLWVNAVGGHATIQRALAVQAYLFLPFTGFSVARH